MFKTMTRLSFMYYVVLHEEDCLIMFFLLKWLEDIWSLSNSKGTFDINSFVRIVFPLEDQNEKQDSIF